MVYGEDQMVVGNWMGNMETPKILYDSISDKESLKKFIQDNQTEALYVEYKSETLDNISGMRENLGKALSGFANSAGGILIFGIKEVGQNKNKHYLSDPILDINKFHQKIQENLSRLVASNVPNVETKKIEDDIEKGYIIVLIPRSENSPHQRIEDKKYYRRSGESFVPMEHFELENMFGRTTKPVLEVDFNIVDNGSAPTIEQDYKIIVGIRNNGRMAATFPYIGLKINTNYKINFYELNGNGIPGLPKLPSSRRGIGSYQEYGGDGNYIIYPEHFLEVTAIDLKKDLKSNSYLPNSDLEIEVKIASKESRLILKEYRLYHSDFENMIRDKKFYSEGINLG